MRIVYFHQYFNLPSEPGSTRSFEMGKRLAAKGHDVHVVTTAREGRSPFRGWRAQTIAGLTVHRTHIPYDNSLGFAGRLQAFFKYAFRAGIRGRHLKPDVIFASSTPLTVAIPARIANLGLAIPIVFEVRDLWPEVPISMGFLRNPIVRWLAYSLQRFAYRNAAHVVALSPDMEAGVLARNYPAENVSVIPNSADLDLFRSSPSAGASFRSRHDWLGGRPLAIYSGTLGRVNDVAYIVRLAREALTARPEYRFMIIGDGSERSATEALAAELGVLDRNLFMFPPIPKTELAPVYSAATIALSTVAPIEALWANSANKVFDAFAAGRPVAINHRGWQADVLQHSGAGLVLDSHDTGRALETLATLMDNQAKADDAGRAAAQLATSRFARDLHGRQLADILESVGRTGLRDG